MIYYDRFDKLIEYEKKKKNRDDTFTRPSVCLIYRLRRRFRAIGTGQTRHLISLEFARGIKVFDGIG